MNRKGTIIVCVSLDVSLYEMEFKEADGISLGNEYILLEDEDSLSNYYFIKDDYNRERLYARGYFISLDEHRKQILNEIINDHTT